MAVIEETAGLQCQEVFTLEEKYWNALNFGLNWESSVDLDASAVCFDMFGHLIDAVYFNQLISADGAIKHSGDNKGEFWSLI
jgi:stress response protein SCP2